MEEFERYSNSMQKIHIQFLEGKEYDCLQTNELHYFKLILSNYIPSNETATKLYENIKHTGNLYYRIIIVNCFMDGKQFSVPVVRVKQNEKPDVFYDTECRKYENWEGYLSKNKLPQCTMMYPANGIYKMEEGKDVVRLEKQKSPASSWLKKIDQMLYGFSNIVATIAAIAPDFKELQPYGKAIKYVSGVSNAYTAAHNGYQIYDHAKHGKSIHYSDADALCYWQNIGAAVLLFGVTVGKVEFGSPRSKNVTFQNLIPMCKMLMESKEGLKKIQLAILSQYLTYFVNEAMETLEREIIPSGIDLKELLFHIRHYVLRGDIIACKFRRFVNVDGYTLSTVARDITFAGEIPRLLRMELYTINLELSRVTDKIIQEVKNWANDNASIMQILFRISLICNGSEGYETVEEMCKHFNVSQPGDITVNGKCLFRGSRSKFLDNLNVKKFPQKLLYTVEYLSNHDDDDDNLEEITKFVSERLINEVSMNMLPLPKVICREKEWINALTLENLSYTHSISQEGISLVKPKDGAGAEVALSDLYKLAKRLVGRVGKLDVEFVRPNVNWIVVASKRSRLAVVIAPKIHLEELGYTSFYYPVFKRPF